MLRNPKILLGLIVGVVVFIVALAGGCQGTGEWFIDGYGGPHFTPNDHLSLDDANGNAVDVGYDALFTAGGRLGHYLDA